MWFLLFFKKKVTRSLGRLLGFWFGLCFCLGRFLGDDNRRRRGGKVGISRLWRDFQRSVGGGGNLLLVFAGFHAPVFSTALFCDWMDQLFSLTVEATHHVRAEPDRDVAIQVLVDRHRAPRQRIAEPCLIDLP